MLYGPVTGEDRDRRHRRFGQGRLNRTAKVGHELPCPARGFGHAAVLTSRSRSTGTSWSTGSEPTAWGAPTEDRPRFGRPGLHPRPRSPLSGNPSRSERRPGNGDYDSANSPRPCARAGIRDSKRSWIANVRSGTRPCTAPAGEGVRLSAESRGDCLLHATRSWDFRTWCRRRRSSGGGAAASRRARSRAGHPPIPTTRSRTWQRAATPQRTRQLATGNWQAWSGALRLWPCTTCTGLTFTEDASKSHTGRGLTSMRRRRTWP